jgi:hypothetical protein
VQPCSLTALWRNPRVTERYKTGVSLHSHTLHSREALDFIPKLSRYVPLVGDLLASQLDQHRQTQGGTLHWEDAFWAPPLSPQQSWTLEFEQIEKLGLRPLVSLTDHDDIEAPTLLSAAHASLKVPISVEWTVPYRNTFFHLGVHNLPRQSARELFGWMRAYTQNGEASDLCEILHTIQKLPDVLCVFNHPLWDEKGLGQKAHDALAAEFLAKHQGRIHALELNGLRPWNENRRVMDWAKQHGVPYVSGGDRHTSEPNACVNLTKARTFDEFVHEVRKDRSSHVLFLNQYRESYFVRIVNLISEVLRPQPAHSLGWVNWMDRVFFTRPNGQTVPASIAWNGKEPAFVRALVRTLSLFEQRPIRHTLRLFSASEQI